jgi:hypothetical protein
MVCVEMRIQKNNPSSDFERLWLEVNLPKRLIVLIYKQSEQAHNANKHTAKVKSHQSISLR